MQILVERDHGLWALKGNGWSLPIIVRWTDGTDVAEVRMHPDVPLLKIQKLAILNKLNEIGHIENGQYRVIAYQLKSVACPCYTDDPEKVVEWAQRENMEVNAELTVDMQEFIASFCQKGYLVDPEKTKFIWNALCSHMLDWVLLRNRVLDLGFADLAAVPFRADWKNEFISRWLHRNSRNIKWMFRSILRKVPEIKQELTRPEYLAKDMKTEHCHRRIEVIHKKNWWDNVRISEMTRDEHPPYWMFIQSLAAHYLNYAMRSLVAYIREVIAPIPFVTRKDATRITGVPKGWGAAQGDFVQVTIADKVCAVTVRDKEIASDGEPFDVAGSEESLSTV